MIDVQSAAALLDMGARIGEGRRAQEQLEGAVALYNLLLGERVAYLADEVGMGKTYVALGVVALFRHFDPSFRVLVIAPRENIQQKWMKEMRNFITNNVRFCDLRIKALDGLSMRPMVSCESLIDLVHESTLAPDRDFFMRLTSFSLALPGRDGVDPERARDLRDKLRQYVPWLDDRIFDLRNKQAFKDNFARAVCCALPSFDLVIIDEGHNLKHGFSENVSARNRVLALAMGHPAAGADSSLFPRYSPRAKRILFLSATPVEETYRHLWNQLDIFGRAAPYDRLRKVDVEEEEKKALAGRFLIRRVTAIHIVDADYTKNLYRREWRRGGMREHDNPIRITDVKQRLAVALVQKKVAEILGHERFNSSFQIGMLASFESFLQTAKVTSDDSESGPFDDGDQADDIAEKEGIDVADVNKLAENYRRAFGTELPHPKMDSLVDSLDGAWSRGQKGLVFVRRVASVKELKRKLDERYDSWIMKRLRQELPDGLITRLERIFEDYKEARRASLAATSANQQWAIPDDEGDDSGGNDTFFAWFFRGTGPANIVSGARIQQRFIERGTTLATFFEDNYLAALFECQPVDVESRLAIALGIDAERLKIGLRARSCRFLSQAKRPARADRFEAIQAAAVEWLTETAGAYQEAARIIWHQRFIQSRKASPAAEGVDPGTLLETTTFFTELRSHATLCQQLWPPPSSADPVENFRERELRRQLLASAARLGHSLIDFYVLAIRRLGSFEPGAQEASERDESDAGPIAEYLNLLESQMDATPTTRTWGAFDELSAIAANFHLILDVNLPGAREAPLSESARNFGKLLRQQQPVGGMAGQVNKTLVAQFRLPGYPMVLISTDLLQEGEDLHTFCSSVYHYGISWTPSSMEQRTGRIDRVRSATDRRLSALTTAPRGDDFLQVYLPHLEDTVEVFQVQRVLERMNTFLRLMHQGLIQSEVWNKRISVANEVVRGRRDVPQIRELLRTAFPVKPELLPSSGCTHVVDEDYFRVRRASIKDLYRRLQEHAAFNWEPPNASGVLLGTATLRARIQPFGLHLAHVGENLVMRCVSPIGNVGPDDRMDDIIETSAKTPVVIGAVPNADGRSYDLTIEGEVMLLDNPPIDVARVLLLLRRIVEQADDLERAFLPGQDAPLSEFRTDLAKEGLDGR